MYKALLQLLLKFREFQEDESVALRLAELVEKDCLDLDRKTVAFLIARSGNNSTLAKAASALSSEGIDVTELVQLQALALENPGIGQDEWEFRTLLLSMLGERFVARRLMRQGRVNRATFAVGLARSRDDEQARCALGALLYTPVRRRPRRAVQQLLAELPWLASEVERLQPADGAVRTAWRAALREVKVLGPAFLIPALMALVLLLAGAVAIFALKTGPVHATEPVAAAANPLPDDVKAALKAGPILVLAETHDRLVARKLLAEVPGARLVCPEPWLRFPASLAWWRPGDQETIGGSAAPAKFVASAEKHSNSVEVRDAATSQLVALLPLGPNVKFIEPDIEHMLHALETEYRTEQRLPVLLALIRMALCIASNDVEVGRVELHAGEILCQLDPGQARRHLQNAVLRLAEADEGDLSDTEMRALERARQHRLIKTGSHEAWLELGLRADSEASAGASS